MSRVPLSSAWMTVNGDPGTGPVKLAVAYQQRTARGFRSFLTFEQAGLQDGQDISYKIEEDGIGWEEGFGTYNDGTLTRNEVKRNSRGTLAFLSFTRNATVAAVLLSEDVRPLQHVWIEDDVPDDGGKSFVFSLNDVFPLPPTSQRTAWRFAADGTPSRMLLDDWGSHLVLTFRRAQGTAAAPSAMTSGQSFGAVTCEGYGATGYVVGYRAKMDFFASENWTDSAQGCHIVFETTPIGSSSPAERLRITDAGRIGIGISAPKAKLSVNENALAVVPPDALSGSSIQLVGANSAAARLETVTWASSGQISLRRAGGSAAASAATESNNLIGAIAAFGHDGSNWLSGSNANIGLWSAEAFSPTARGTKIRLQTTPIGGTAAATRLSVMPDGALAMGVSEDTVIDANRHQVLRGYTVAQVAGLSAAPAGQMIYVSDETGGAVPAFSDGTNWRRVTDRAIVS